MLLNYIIATITLSLQLFDFGFYLHYPLINKIEEITSVFGFVGAILLLLSYKETWERIGISIALIGFLMTIPIYIDLFFRSFSHLTFYSFLSSYLTSIGLILFALQQKRGKFFLIFGSAIPLPSLMLSFIPLPSLPYSYSYIHYVTISSSSFTVFYVSLYYPPFNLIPSLLYAVGFGLMLYNELFGENSFTYHSSHFSLLLEIRKIAQSFLILFATNLIVIVVYYVNKSPIVINVILVIGMILVAINIFALIKIKNGFSKINDVVSLDLGITGTKLSLIGFALALLALVFFLSSAFLFYLFLFGYFLYLMSLGTLTVGYILLGIGVYKIGKAFTNTLTKAGGILISVLILSIIGFILSYFGLKEVKPEINIQGEGIVENGVTKISVYSNVKGYVESISSAGTLIFDFEQKELKEGETVIEVNEELQDPIILTINVGGEKIDKVIPARRM